MKIQFIILGLLIFATVAHSENEVETRNPERRNFGGLRLNKLDDISSENLNDTNNVGRRRHHHFTHNTDWHRRHGIPMPNGRPIAAPVAAPAAPLDEIISNRLGDDVFSTTATAANITSEECLTKYQQEQDNLKVVLAFYEEAFGQHDITAVDRYISPDYIQHNPKVGDGKQPLVDFLIPFNAIKVKGPVDIRHTAANGDLVWLHLKTTGFSGEPLAIIDVFRIKDGKIIEHWDVIQEIPPMKDSKNLHPMF